MKPASKYPVIIFSISVVVLMAILGVRCYRALYKLNPARSRGEFAEVSIKPGMSVRTTGELLEVLGVVDHAADFVFSARFLLLDHRIQAAEYALPYGKSNVDILERLVHGVTGSTYITIPEGYTSRQIASLLQETIGMDSAWFMQVVEDTALIAQYGLDAPSFAGFLFPDSYDFYRVMKPSWIIHRMVKRFFEIFDTTHQAQAAELGFTLTEIVTLASIIEGEMLYKSEAPLISAVYHNRLKRRMLPQADPTIQYLIPGGPRRLYRSDLTIKSPYNTYIHRGLPPGPVCNPGRTTLIAALNPAPEPYLFMVSSGDGYHAFNTSFIDHIRDKARLDSLRQALAQSRSRLVEPFQQ